MLGISSFITQLSIVIVIALIIGTSIGGQPYWL